MNLTVTGHHVDLTESMRDYVNGKMERIERHFDNLTKMHVILTVEKERQKAEATISVRGATLFANSEEQNMYTAIDLLADKLDRQVVKHKEKLKDHHKREKEELLRK